MDNQSGATPSAGEASGVSSQQPGASAAGLQDTVKQEAQNLAQTAQNKLQDLGGEAKSQVTNLGKAGVEQVQNLGQAGVVKAGSLLSQIINPEKGNQPPVNKEDKIYAALAYLPFVALLSIIIKPDSAYVRLHAKQGLLLSLLFFFVGMFAVIASVLGPLGEFLALLIGLVPMFCLVAGAYSMYLAAYGFWWKMPVLGPVADLIPIEWMAKTSKENITGQVGVAKNDYDVRQDTLQKEKAENTAPVAAAVPPAQAASSAGNAATTTAPVQGAPVNSASSTDAGMQNPSK